MNLSAAYCKAILDTLPIGYYLGKAVDVEMSMVAPTSACDMQSETIIISYPAIAQSLAAAPETDDPEWQVRTHLYHEISHLLLTPKNLGFYAMNVANKYPSLKPICAKAQEIMNIVEDERIEMLMKRHFMNVDFERSLELENPPAVQLMTDPDPMARFFAAVRFHMCTDQSAMDAIGRMLSVYYNEPSNLGYAKRALEIYLRYFHLNTEKNSGQSEQNNPQESASQADEQPEEKDQENTPSAQGQSKNSGNAQNEAERKKAERRKAKFEAALVAAIEVAGIKACVRQAVEDHLTNKDVGQITTRMKKIIQAAMNRRALQAPSSSAYAGKIDPRLTANKNYRWFIKSNKGSDGNKFSKIKINLFVDVSGSFHRSISKVNAILKAFREVKTQMPEFDYDVITLERGEILIPKTTRSLDTGGCNLLDPEIFKLYKQVQNPNARVINVLVLDGYAWTNISYERSRVPEDLKKCASAFNHPNCIAVIDVNNEQEFTRYAPQAKRIVLDDDYVQVFSEKVFESLERLLA